MSFAFQDSKSERKLAFSWNILLNIKHYLIPQTIEEYQKNGSVLLTPTLKIKSSYWFFTEKSKSQIREFVSTIYSIREIQDTVIYNTVYQSTIKELEIEIHCKLESKPIRDFKDVLEAIFVRISEQRRSFQFYFALEGLELQDIKQVDFGAVKVILLDEEFKKYIYLPTQKYDKNEELERYTIKFIDDNLLNKVCIKCLTFGDSDKAQEIARFRAREVINFFRYLICVLGHQRIYENLIQINILSEAYIQSENFLAINQEKGSIIIASGKGRKNLEKFPINEDRVRELKEKVFLDEIVKIFNSNERTELEGCIVTAIYWAGEAQNEFDWDVAFLKYWTALECIFSYKKEQITHSLAKGVSILIAFSNYRFIEINNISEVYKKISKLYEMRSQIIHRGLRGTINELQLADICKYTSWTILSLLDLRAIGYTIMEEIDNQTTRLYDMLKLKAP